VELIFEPGLSTAKQTTEVSGRGVGMDIVRRYIEELNGRVEVQSTVGAGTRFSLRLPLTLATFGGLLVRSSGRTYALPLSFVQETVKPDRSALGTVLTKSVMHLRGGVMPLLRLNEAMLHTGTQRAAVAADEALFAVVVRAGEGEHDRPVAIAVDELIDQQDLVVKTLGGYMGKTRGIAGASILGDGDVVLIVDVPSLIKSALQSADAGVAEATERKGSWAA
jgi:two-component system chemotaxis sensor kinase CheA